MWSEATAASEATPVDPAAAAAAVDTTWYMMLYFAFGMTSLAFQVGTVPASFHSVHSCVLLATAVAGFVCCGACTTSPLLSHPARHVPPCNALPCHAMPGLQVVKAVMLVFGSVNAARVLQERLLACVVLLPMSFFDSQPTGRLLNRFTKDTGALGVFIGCVV